jgi:mono/diheme cytochrome c family protein
MRSTGLALMTLMAAASAHAQSANDGRALFVANGCYQCHGFVGQGGAAPRIAPTAYPAYAPQALGDDALRAIYAYLRSIPEPPPLVDIAILR